MTISLNFLLFFFSLVSYLNVECISGGFLGILCCKAHRKLPNNENIIQPEIVSVTAGP